MNELFIRIRKELDCSIGYGEPGGELIIELPDERCFVAPDGITDDSVRGLLDRSLQSGRNLFAEEWETYQYEDNIVL